MHNDILFVYLFFLRRYFLVRESFSFKEILAWSGKKMFETNVFCIDRFENIPKKREKKILIHKVCAQAMIPYKNWNGIKFFRSVIFLFFWKFFDHEWNWIILNWIRISIRDHSTRDVFLHVQGRERYSFKYRIGSKIILVKDRENLRVSLLALLISIRSRCLSRLVKSKPRLLPSHFSFLLPLPPPRSFFRQHAARKCERITIHPRTCLVIIIYKNETLGKMEACRVSPVSFPGTDETFATTESRTRRDRIQRPKWKSQRELARLFHFVRTSFSRQEFACISSRLESFALRGHYLPTYFVFARLPQHFPSQPGKTTGIIAENLSSRVVAISRRV